MSYEVGTHINLSHLNKPANKPATERALFTAVAIDANRFLFKPARRIPVQYVI